MDAVRPTGSVTYPRRNLLGSGLLSATLTLLKGSEKATAIQSKHAEPTVSGWSTPERISPYAQASSRHGGQSTIGTRVNWIHFSVLRRLR